ncbi:MULTISPECIES: rhodanese-like domain-containing protein [unclassified Thioalkalivibrio]|uniref:MBL fold metallo-hydrolase n=1 Tax=unclassified Thioalkalivibrio TaxID=2621013 RepID=UPI0003768DA9|nr:MULTISPECIES: rhodanese-like domain-containing protein [unclassified Thioalkalivibrio]
MRAIWLGLALAAVGSSAAQADVLTGDTLLEAANAEITNIDQEGLQDLIASEPDHVVIDVRTRTEIDHTGGQIRSSETLNIPRGWIEFEVPGEIPDKDTPIVVYCGQNLRSVAAAQTLQQMGYTNVYNYPGGFFEWKDAGLPLYVLDKARDSFLYDRPQEVTDGVWSAIGATQPSTYENSGHNNNLSFIITDDGVVVMNAGDNYLLAKSLHQEIKAITDQPVKYVVLENAQGHAMLGMTYWQEQGATVIAHNDAWREIEANGQASLEAAATRTRDKAFMTELGTPDVTFATRLDLEMGGETIQILYLGPGHAPGDIALWAPERKVLITGDLAFHQRMLPIFEYTDTAGWIETWHELEALEAEYIIPGHGGPVNDFDVLRRYTHDYLVYLREEVQRILDEGGTLNDAYNIDQTAYRHLDTYGELHRQNAGRVFRAMEFEDF